MSCKTNCTGNDDFVEWHDGPILEFRSALDHLETCCLDCFPVCRDFNKFWEKYYGVINLSDRKLNNIELSVLGNGLKFCPTPMMVDHGNLKISLDNFMRICSLRLFFSDMETEPYIEHQAPFSHKDLKLPSRFNPHMPSNLEHVYYLILNDLLSFRPERRRYRKSNLTSSQETALRNLSLNENIIIKKADKGSNVVILNKSDYIQECQRQLNDMKFYLKLDEDLTPKFKKKVDTLVTEMFENEQV